MGIINRIKPSGFSRQIAVLASGNIIAQGITFLLTSILTRLYTPVDYGNYNIIMSIVSVFSVAICLRYELAIMRPSNDTEASKVLVIASSIAFTFFLLSIVIICFFSYFKLLSFWFVFIPFLSFLIGLNQIFINWNNRKKKYLNISINRLINSILTSTVPIGLFFLKASSFGLFIGTIVGNIFSLIPVFTLKLDLRKYFNKRDLILIAKKYIDMPTTNLFQAIVDLLLINSMIYIITILFSKSVLGYYSLSMRVLQAPIYLIGASIAQVFYQHICSIYNNGGNIKDTLVETIKKAAILSLPMPIILLFFGPSLFSFFFGEEWQIAGEYARILSPWFYFDFIRMTVSQLPIILSKQRELFKLSLFNFFLLITSMLIGKLIFNDFIIGLKICSIFLSLFTIYIIYWFYKISKSQ